MTRTYQATGIILKGMPLGEADRLVTILTPEYGLIRAVVPGARKHKSSLRGRSELFVVNQLLIAKGRSLDKVTQAETINSYRGLSKDLGKLTASQYLAELALCLALSEQPQTEIYELLNEHFRRIEQLSTINSLYAHLSQAVFHLLALGGIGPQVYHCCLTRQSIKPRFTDAHWRVGFSFETGGIISLSQDITEKKQQSEQQNPSFIPPKINWQLTAVELSLLQQLGKKDLPHQREMWTEGVNPQSVEIAWIRVERILREYVQYHFGHSFRSAALVDALAPVDF